MKTIKNEVNAATKAIAALDLTQQLEEARNALARGEDITRRLEEIRNAVNSRTSQIVKAAEGVLQFFKWFEDQTEAKGYPRGTWYAWAEKNEAKLNALDDEASEEAKPFEHLPIREYIDKRNEIFRARALAACFEDLTKAEKEDEAPAFSLVSAYTKISDSFSVAFNNNQTTNKLWRLAPGESASFLVKGSPVRVSNLIGYKLTDWDLLVFFAAYHVAANNAPVLDTRRCTEEHPDGEPVLFASYADIARQLRDGALDRRSAFYAAVKESLDRVMQTKFLYDYRGLIDDESGRQYIGAADESPLEGNRVIVKAHNQKDKEGITIKKSWFMDLLKRAGNNPSYFQMFRTYFSGVRFDGRQDGELFCFLFRRGTNTAPNSNRVWLYAKGNQTETLFKALGMDDISTIERPTPTQRTRDNRARQKIEDILKALKASGRWDVELIKEGPSKKLVGFVLRIRKEDAEEKAAIEPPKK